jgi:hypothetical protein
MWLVTLVCAIYEVAIVCLMLRRQEERENTENGINRIKSATRVDAIE